MSDAVAYTLSWSTLNCDTSSLIVDARSLVSSFRDLLSSVVCTLTAQKPKRNRDKKKNDHERDDNGTRKLGRNVAFRLTFPARMEDTRHRESYSAGFVCSLAQICFQSLVCSMRGFSAGSRIGVVVTQVGQHAPGWDEPRRQRSIELCRDQTPSDGLSAV